MTYYLFAIRPVGPIMIFRVLIGQGFVPFLSVSCFVQFCTLSLSNYSVAK